MNYNIILIIALVIVALSMLGMLVRVIIGPSLADRVVALDAMGIQLMAIVALFSIFLGTKYMIVAILLIGILAFLGTAVFAKYMDKGKVIEMITTIVISIALILVILGSLISALAAIGLLRLTMYTLELTQPVKLQH
ncbi:Na(+)/H(+) antiporter subunit F1 [Staphylococcus xylosus]|uniref:Na(+)/H(+) antiporter subunit F1 n=1 Tax=Staphylococcus xylosus TaxID=1288 RepID=A0A939NII0_STAXY|nr:Na(+)/H(+) antiporter subunit F1 [Staphylococcus xylosus]